MKTLIRRGFGLLLAGLLVALAPAQPALAARALTLTGAGLMTSSGASVEFAVDLTEAGSLTFTLTDTGLDGARTFTLESGTVDCLGNLFGGQTARINGRGWDSAAPSELASFQIFLVDGGDSAASRISLKVRRRDGTTTYFLPMRDLDTGSVSLVCG